MCIETFRFYIVDFKNILAITINRESSKEYISNISNILKNISPKLGFLKEYILKNKIFKLKKLWSMLTVKKK